MFKSRNATATFAALAGTLLCAGCKLNLAPDLTCVFIFCEGTVTGRVTDAATGANIAGAQVSGPGKYAPASVTTDANGQYSLSVWAHADTLYANAPGHSGQSQVVSVRPDKPVSADFALTPLPPP